MVNALLHPGAARPRRRSSLRSVDRDALARAPRAGEPPERDSLPSGMLMKISPGTARDTPTRLRLPAATLSALAFFGVVALALGGVPAAALAVSAPATTPATTPAATPAPTAESVIALQARVVDEGAFSITIDGLSAGRESFVIRSYGDGDGSYLANATIELGGAHESTRTTILRANAPGGETEGYELSVSGAEENFRVTIPSIGADRFNSHYVSSDGQESREYAGGPQTRVIEDRVAHHHFALASLRAGTVVPVIVPGERRSGQIEVISEDEDELVVAGLSLPTRKLALAGYAVGHFVWFDARGRVVRVEIQELGYVAQRTDLGVGVSLYGPAEPGAARNPSASVF